MKTGCAIFELCCPCYNDANIIHKKMTEVSVQSKRSWPKIVLIVVLAVVVILGVLFLVQKSYTPKNGFIVMSGTLQCLPKVNIPANMVYTFECAVGLKSTNGRYYELTGRSAVSMEMGSFVVVVGTLDTSTPSDTYNSAGVIHVTSII